MRRIMFEVTDELGTVLDEMLPSGSKNRTLEDWLWRRSDVRETARALGVERKKRRGRGQPRKVKR